VTPGGVGNGLCTLDCTANQTACGPLGGVCVAIDVSEGMLSQVKENLRHVQIAAEDVELVNADVEELQNLGVYDRISANFMLYHLKDIEAALIKIANSLTLNWSRH